MSPGHRIAGSPGSEPESNPPSIFQPSSSSAILASLVSIDGVVFVDIEGRLTRLRDVDAARLRSSAASPPAASSGTPEELKPAIDAARSHREELMRYPNVLRVRAGYKFTNGLITPIPAVVVSVDRKRTGLPRDQMIPALIGGVHTDVTVADPIERLEAAGAPIAKPPLLIDQIQSDEETGIEAVPHITYQPPAGATLDPVTGAMVITCHVSPDAGWGVLRPFLEGARDEVVLGMYDFTAPHIYQTIRSLLRDSEVRWRQTLGPNEALPAEDDVDSTKADDKTEASVINGLKRVAPDRFESAFAHVGAGQTFASAYHIKVAVRDKDTTWLSSGNWQSSNQPAIDFLDASADRKLIPRYNREWHVVIESAELADRFRRYLQGDFKTAREGAEGASEAATALPDLIVPVDELLVEERSAVDLEVFPPARFTFGKDTPLTIQPILTPDNYLDIVLDLLRGRPTSRLYFQNQSLNPVKSPTAEWKELMKLLADYSQDDSLDVRIIFRNIGPIRKKLESLQAVGFKMDRVRMQAGCHTKGIVIDSSTVLLGSHNWTNQGVQVNRDASLLIRHEPIAKYYERVFLHDWEHLARATIREEAMPVPISPGDEVAGADATRLRRIPWSAWREE